ncbi:Uncharacterised protein [Mycobacteroides abscessus subsp. massiliense]|nr:Uncharacterised protein [Mycobacteroides abscessus subsp. massiliense]
MTRVAQMSRISASSVKATFLTGSPTLAVDTKVNIFSFVVRANRISSAVPATLGPNNSP